MENVGIDVHKKESQVCILSVDGSVIEMRIRTQRERFAEVFRERPRSRILIEASTESEWVARCLEELGHEVVVADPNFSPMYATRSRRVKTDKRDARTLADACKLGAYKPAHRTSDARRHLRAQLAVRESLVRTRAKLISLTRALLRREGIPVGTGSAAAFSRRLKAVELPEYMQHEVAPVLALMEPLNAQIAALDEALEREVSKDAQVLRLCSAPRVGAVTACAFAAAVDDAKRFASAHQVEAYFGLVPSESSSGEKQRKGRITKAGNTRVRWLLVQAAVSILRLRTPDTLHLRTWAERIASRRGRKTAVVALARKLAGILFAMMRDGTTYTPPASRAAAAPPLEAAAA
ncbi:MAG: IS110 family transposase [Myxococcaceae bacterium]|nr:IS110 family transposase [Myxococcaceae bacterium]MCI0673627.1 IS110 family transposase [Myxococcaceae bacterium]